MPWRYARPRLRRWLIFLVLLPFWTSLLVRTFATVILLQRTGPLNALLVGFGLTEQPLPLLYNLTGVMVGAVQVLLPFVIFPLHAAMARIEPAYMQAALTLGATPVRAFLRVYLPLTLPGLVTGATLVFISTLGYFVTPAMLGGPRQLMIAQLIQDQIGDFGNWGMAGALSLVLSGDHRRPARPAARHRRAEGGGAMKGDGMARWRALRGDRLRRWSRVYLIAPLAIVMIISFSSAPFLQFPPPGLSLRWYANLFGDAGWTRSIWSASRCWCRRRCWRRCWAPPRPMRWCAAASRAPRSSPPA